MLIGRKAADPKESRMYPLQSVCGHIRDRSLSHDPFENYQSLTYKLLMQSVSFFTSSSVVSKEVTSLISPIVSFQK